MGIFAFDTVAYQDVHLTASTPVEMLLPDAETFSKLEALPGPVLHEQSIFSPDRSLVAGYFRSELTTVWRLADGKLINQFDGQPKDISPDNRLIAMERRVPYDTYTVYFIDLYNLQTGEQLGSWQSVRAFFLSDSRLVVEADWYTRVFDPQTRKVPHAFPGQFAAFSSDEQNVAVLYGNRIHVYRVSDGKLLHNLDSGLPSTDEAVLRFSANGEILAGLTSEFYCCAGYSNKLFVWQVSDGHLLADLSWLESSSFSLSPDGQAIIVEGEVLHTSDGSLIADLKTYFTDVTDRVTNLAFIPDGEEIIVAAKQNLYVYPVGSDVLNPVELADPETYLPVLQAAVPHPYPDGLMHVSSPVGKFIALRQDGVVTLMSTSGEAPYKISTANISRLAFSPDGQILALGSEFGVIELWDVNQKQKLHTIYLTNDVLDSVGGLGFSPDGKLLAIGLGDGTVRFYGINPR